MISGGAFVAPANQAGIKRGRVHEASTFGLRPRNIDLTAAHCWVERPTFQECLEEVVRIQSSYPFDPKRPTGSIVRVFRAVRDNLPITLREYLGVYCALWTTYDFWYGADGFFRLENNPNCPVNFDVTLRTQKRSRLVQLITKRDIDRSKNVGRIGRIMANRLIILNGEKVKRRNSDEIEIDSNTTLC